MEYILLFFGGAFVLFSSIAIWKKGKEKKNQEMIRLFEEMERRRHIENLSINWNSFQEKKRKSVVRPSIRRDDMIDWSEEEERAKEAWDKINEVNV